MTRTLVVKEISKGSGFYNYTATVSDVGTFTSIKDALTPNQGAPYAGKAIANAVTGKVTGFTTYTFTASTLPSKSFVITSEAGTPASTGPNSTSFWFEQAFSRTTTFGGPGINNTWIWTYTYNQAAQVGSTTVSLPEFWVDSAAHGGQDPADGNIDGNLVVS